MGDAAGVDEFEAFWRSYPRTGPVGSKHSACMAWAKLSAADRERAVRNMQNYNLARGQQIAVHCSTYLGRSIKSFVAWDETPLLPPPAKRSGRDQRSLTEQMAEDLIRERQARRDSIPEAVIRDRGEL